MGDRQPTIPPQKSGSTANDRHLQDSLHVLQNLKLINGRGKPTRLRKLPNNEKRFGEFEDDDPEPPIDNKSEITKICGDLNNICKIPASNILSYNEKKFGEFEIDSNKDESSDEFVQSSKDIKKTTEDEPMDDDKQQEACAESEDMSLKERLITHLANSDVIVKSQQRGEPDLTVEEKKTILNDLLEKKPCQFLYRFKSSLMKEHLQYFMNLSIQDPDVQYYLSEAQKLHNQHTSMKRIRNRRYAALQRMRKNGDYFSEEEMKRREPLLYEQLVEHYMSREAREDPIVSDNEISFSNLLLHNIDKQQVRDLKKIQADNEDAMFEEEDESDSDEGEDVDMEDTNSEERLLLKEEFISIVYNKFLDGKDADFDYKSVDYCEDYDLLDVEDRDQQDIYFDSEDVT